MTLPINACAIACGFQVILRRNQRRIEGGPTNWSDVLVFYDSTAGCAASCSSGAADTILLISDSSADADTVLSEAAIGEACPGLTSAAIQGGLPGTPTPAGVPEESMDGYEHTTIAALTGEAISFITITNAGSFVPAVPIPMLSSRALVLVSVALLSFGMIASRVRRRW
jgi:hypothetical protein